MWFLTRGGRAGVNLQVAPEPEPQNLCYPGRRGAVGRLKSHAPPPTSEHFTPTAPGVGAQLRSLAPEPLSIRVAQSWGLLTPKSGSVIHERGAGLLAAAGRQPHFCWHRPAYPPVPRPSMVSRVSRQCRTAGPTCLKLRSPECSPPLSPRLWDLGGPRVGLSQPLDDWSGPLESQRPSDDRPPACG